MWQARHSDASFIKDHQKKGALHGSWQSVAFVGNQVLVTLFPGKNGGFIVCHRLIPVVFPSNSGRIPA
jgi:hypothetical protein